MALKYKADVTRVNQELDKKIKTLISETYLPIFDRVMTRAQGIMLRDDVQEIKLDNHKGLYFTKEGKFVLGEKREVIGLPKLAQEYIDESAYIAACGDHRGHIPPSMQQALGTALDDLVEKTKRALVESF